MNVNEQNKFLSREEAWWFIPEEYCPIFLKLEKEFNKKIGSPISKQQLLEWTDFLKSEQMKHFYGLADKNIITIAELTKAIQDTGDSGKKMSHAKAKVKAEIRNKRYKGYGEILEELETKVIVGHFLSFFENVGILINDDNKNYSFSKVSNHISDYKVPYITAQIILEHITRDLKHNSASRAVLLEAMHNLIHDPLFDITIVEKKEDKEVALETVYLDRFNDGLQILKNNGIVKKKKGVTGHYEFIFDIPSGLMSDKDACKAINDNKKRRKAAFDELQQIHARFHQTTSTSKEKVKARIKRALSIISEKLSKIDQLSINDRIIFHWSNVILQCCNHVDFRRFQAFANDVLTYIRYCNIKNAITPITKDALYPWESLYPVWDAIGKVIQNEAKLPIINWPEYVSDIDYQKAVGNILNVINHLIDNNTIEDLYSKRNLDNKTIEQIKIRNEQLISLLYVRATIELNVSHSDALGHLENLFKIISQNKGGKNYYDLCLVVSKLSRLACEDSFEYSSKARKWIYVFNNIPECADNFDAQNVLADIYLHLIGMAGDESLSDRYRKKCSQLIKNIKVSYGNVKQLLELTTRKYLYLLYTIDSLNYKEASEWILDLWKNVLELFTIADTKDPRPNILKYETFIIAANLLNKYLNFGFSLSLLTVNAILHLKSIGVKSYINYFHLLEGLGNFIEPFEPEVSLRVKMQIEPDYPNKLYIDHEIAIQFFDKGCFDLAFDYAKKAEENFNSHNLNDIESVAYYIDVRLSQINALFLLGNDNRAIEILLECGNKLSELGDLYPEKERACILQGVIDHYHNIKSELDKHPFYSRELRLDYVLTAIWQMEAKSIEIEDFYEKWKQFNGMYRFHNESIDMALKEEFESDRFAATIEEIASRVVFSSPEIDLSPIRDEEITLLKNNLEESYELYQRSFLIYDDNEIIVNPELPIETPTYERLFEFFEPDNGRTVFATQQKTHAVDMSGTNEYATAEELEKYHYVVMSELSSAEDAFVAADLFMKRIEFAVETTYIKEMAAEVLCEQSILIDCDNWDEKERLLNMAESYIVEKNGTFLSDKAKEIYIRIAHRLCDVYEYRSQEGASSDYSKHALDIVRLYNIRTVDSAWFIGEHAERLMYEAKSQGNTNLLSEAKDLFTESIEILQSVNPQTDDSRHYLELYEEFLSQL